MATNMIFKYEEKNTRVRTLAGQTAGGAPLLDPADARPAVTLTATGGFTKTVTTNLPFGWGSVTGVAAGGEGLATLDATLAYDGAWELPVSGATTGTAQGAQVYITSGNALNLTASGNTAYGRVDYPLDYKKVAGVLPVRIGA